MNEKRLKLRQKEKQKSVKKIKKKLYEYIQTNKKNN